MVARPVIASRANTTWHNWRIEVVDKHGLSTVNNAIISGTGVCPFKVM